MLRLFLPPGQRRDGRGGEEKQPGNGGNERTDTGWVELSWYSR